MKKLASLAAVLVLLLNTPAPAAPRRPGAGPTLLVTLSGDLSQGSLLRSMSLALPGAAGACVRQAWWDRYPGIDLPNGQTLIAGGVPVVLQMRIPAITERPMEIKLLETTRQKRAFGLLGIETFTSLKEHRFQRIRER